MTGNGSPSVHGGHDQVAAADSPLSEPPSHLTAAAGRAGTTVPDERPVMGVDVGGTRVARAALGEEPVLAPSDCDRAEKLIAQIAVRYARWPATETSPRSASACPR